MAKRLHGFGNWPRRVGWVAVSALLFRFCLVTQVRAWQIYNALTPLQLPGARRLHLDHAEVVGLRDIVTKARSSCTVLMRAPGMPTFNSWTGLPPIPGLGGGNWVTGLDDAAQEKIVREMPELKQICVIYNSEMIAMWTHDSDVSGRPAIRYVRENFRPVAEGRGNVLMVRR